MTDFAIRPSIYPRLSKLILTCMLSHEAKALMEQAVGKRVLNVGTTAFTDNSTSMKYRGLLEVYNRKEGAVNYIGKTGRWTLAKGLEQWLKKS
jgi:hypothetical protein